MILQRWRHADSRSVGTILCLGRTICFWAVAKPSNEGYGTLPIKAEIDGRRNRRVGSTFLRPV